MHLLIRFSILSICCLTLTGCAINHFFCKATGYHSVPQFREKNEFRLSGGYTESDYTMKGMEFQAAYSVTDKFAVMASAGIADSPSVDGEMLFEAGFGYFKPVTKRSVFEMYAIGGLGSVKDEFSYTGFYPNRDKTYYADMSARFTKFYLQPSFAVGNKVLDVALSAKFGALYFYGLNSRIEEMAGMEEAYQMAQEEFGSLANNRMPLFVEPAVTVKAGYKMLKLHGQFGYGIYSNGFRNIADKPFFNVGLTMALNRLYLEELGF